MHIEYILLIGSALILVSVALAKASDNLGIPTLLLFLGVGMLAGSEGPGGIEFDDAHLAQSVGTIALIYILFAGGLDTKWADVKPVFWQAVSLSTLGVLITAIAVAFFATAAFHMPLLSGLLLGSVVSSTDAAAIFSVLRSKNVNLRGSLKPLLELESGTNDPMAVFLTVGLIQLMTIPQTTFASVVMLFTVQMAIGGLFGLGFGKALVYLINRLRLPYEGIYSVFVLAFAALIYGATASIGGSGFLAVYVAALVAGKDEFVQKRSLLRFFDGAAWLSQMAMFLTLGLLVFPSHVASVTVMGLLTAGFLMLVARPLSVFVSLLFFKQQWRERVFISWVGLRGAVPIVLATFPRLAGVPDAELIFNVVFFIVLTSALVQGWSIPPVAKVLRLSTRTEPSRRYPIEFAPVHGIDTNLVDVTVPFHSHAAGKSIIELGLPPDTLIVLISRDDSFIVPSGGTVLQESDTALILVDPSTLPRVRAIFEKQDNSAETRSSEHEGSEL